LASANQLPDASITDAGLKITPLDAAVPEAAQQMIDQTAMMLPHVKITELLLEVDAWTGFTRHFTHLKTGEIAKNKSLLLTSILADAINLGLSKMAESCPGTTYARLSWLQAWHIRDEPYSKALAELVNAQSRHPFAEHWGDGTILAAMALHNIAVNLLDRAPTVVAEPEAQKSRSKRVLKLSGIGGPPESKTKTCSVSRVSMACGSEYASVSRFSA
jgi:hypothetical protein